MGEPAPKPPSSGLRLSDGMFDAHGRWVPKRLIKDIDVARDELVHELVAEARAVSETLGRFKARLVGDIDAFVSMSAERYGAKTRGTKGGVVLTSYDGRYRIVRQVQDRLEFDERLQAAKVLVDECIREWAADASDEIKALVGQAFQVDKVGKVSTERVLRLRQLNIQEPRWLSAMQAIADATKTVSSKTYVRLYERVGDSGDEYRPIPLDLSAL